MTTPCVALLQFIFLKKTTSGATVLALAAVCVGVGLTNTGGTGTTSLGTSIAVAAFTVTAFYQVWIGKKLQDFKVSRIGSEIHRSRSCNSWQLLLALNSSSVRLIFAIK